MSTLEGRATYVRGGGSTRARHALAVLLFATTSAAGTACADPAPPAAPFAFADFSWVPGGAGASERPLAIGPFTGEFRLDDAYRYLSEAYGELHLDAMHGVNIQAGLFMSYIGLWSYYNADNWTYQPSYVSSNTPWFFNGMRVRLFPSDKLKIEPWLVNGWQSYGRFNNALGVGGQVMWRPNGSISVVGNQYCGSGTFGNATRKRMHTDDSFMFKLIDRPEHAISKAAASLTVDAGANPGRYLVLMPPINGATALSGTPYFKAKPGDSFRASDMQVSADITPQPFVTFRAEYNHRAANVPYFAGRGGLAPPGGNQGTPGSLVSNWAPDLVKTEDRLSLAMLIRM